MANIQKTMNIDNIIIWCEKCMKKTKHLKNSYYKGPDDWSIKFDCTECKEPIIAHIELIIKPQIKLKHEKQRNDNR